MLHFINLKIDSRDVKDIRVLPEATIATEPAGEIRGGLQ